MDPTFESKFKDLQAKTKAGVLVGLKDIAGVGQRVDIDVLLSTQPKTFNLFILALDALQKVPRSDVSGYFQLAGIHGLPFERWNNVGAKRTSNPGYCAHGLNTFPTWHRAYLGLFEQSLFVKCVEIALKYDEPHRKEYLQAAKLFRLPYWDWFRARGGQVTFPGVTMGDSGEGRTSYPYDFSAPRIFTEESVTIRQYPKNTLDSVPNPFHHYAFTKDQGELTDQEWAPLINDNNLLMRRDQTARHPYPNLGRGGKFPKGFEWNNPIRMNTVLNELRMDATRVLLNMMQSEVHKTYEIFACSGKPDKRLQDKISSRAFGSSGSLESLHGLYHGLCGGSSPGSHMSRVPTAAFDPIFWFHHGNIERLFTIWQAINKNDQQNRNWFPNSQNEAKDPLIPFIKETSGGQNSFWNSNMIKGSEALGYTYPEVLQSGNTLNNFKNLYEWSVPDSALTSAVIPPASMKALDLSESYFFRPAVEDAGRAPEPIFHHLLSTSVQLPPVVAEIAEKRVQKMVTTTARPKSDDIWEWSIYDQVERLALNGSFSILYFVKWHQDETLGGLDELVAAPDLAGITYNFAAPTEVCDNCGQQAEQAVMVENHVAITSQLLDYVENGQLASMSAEHVRPFLVKRLRWRIVNVNGELFDPRELAERKGLSIGLVSRRTSASLPEPEVQVHDDVIAQIIGQASSQAGSATASV